MTRMVSKASLINLAGAAAVVLTCGAWGAANGMVQEPPANARTPGYDLKTSKKAVTAAERTAPPELSSCASGTATACRAIEAGMARSEWTWLGGGVTAMDDWERQAARADASKMTLKFKPETTRRTVAPPATPTPETVQRVLTACDNGDVTACAAFAASIGPRVHNIPAAPAS